MADMNTIKTFIPTAAKAVAMFTAPFALLLLAWVADNIGVNIASPELDEAVTWITAAIVAIINSVWTYYQPNHTPVE